ncbi:transposase, partial [Bifidobacterium pullorum subsp. gallinarum]
AMESRASALAKAETVASEMETRKLRAAANCLREGIGETTTYLLDEYPARAPTPDPHQQHDRTAEP